jgi:hypothetical protein
MDSYNNLLDHVQRTRPANAGLTTECTADPFIKNMPGYLTWLWLKNNQVPAFVVIYSGYVTMFGRNYRAMPWDDDQGQRIMISQSFTYGEQLGWNDPDLYLQMKHKDFYKKCVQERAKIGSYMYDGKLLHSPEFKDDQPKLRTDKCKAAYYGLVEHSAVFAEHWERNCDGKRLLVIVNASENEAKVEFTAQLDDGKYILSGDTSGIMEITNGYGSAVLPPLSVVYAAVE